MIFKFKITILLFFLIPAIFFISSCDEEFNQIIDDIDNAGIFENNINVTLEIDLFNITEETEDLNIKITEETTEYLILYEINPKFDEYLKINGDIVGEIKINGTNIDFPVVFSGENEYYLKHDIYGNYTKYGAIFMDEINRGAILDRNTLIHGHNFEGIDDKMFADLEKYKNKDFFENNKIIIYNNLYSDMEWEVFSVYVVSEKDYEVLIGFYSEQAFIDYVEIIKAKSMFESDYTPKAGDYILTLNTCSYEFKNAHTIIHARLIKKIDNIHK